MARFLETADPDRLYAEWYAWAKREVSPDAGVCGGAAQAALLALGGSGDVGAAVLAARQSRAGRSAVLLRQVSPRRRAYAEWYDWARRELGGPPPRLHVAAGAALAALEEGASSPHAAEAARGAVGEPGVATSTSEAGGRDPLPPAPGQTLAAPPAPGGPLPAPPPRPELMYAGAGRRAVALLIDGLVLLVPLLVAAVAAASIPGLVDDPVPVLVAFGAFWVLLLWSYTSGLESSSLQATLGKAALGSVVCDRVGRPAGFLRASGRFWIKLLLTVAVLPAPVNLVTLIRSPRRQALHDAWSGTLVVRREYAPLVARQAEEPAGVAPPPPPPARPGPLAPIPGTPPP